MQLYPGLLPVSIWICRFIALPFIFLDLNCLQNPPLNLECFSEVAHKSETILSGFYFYEVKSRTTTKKVAELVPSVYLCFSTVEILCPKFKLMLLLLDQISVEKFLLENKHLATLKGMSVMFGISLHELKQ